MFLPNPGILASGSGERTYADFLDRINAISTYPGTSFTFQNKADDLGTSAISAVIVANSSSLGTMYGSPWGPLSPGGFQGESVLGFVARHGLPSSSDWSAQIASGRRLLFDISSRFQTDNFPAVNRNGALSQALPGSWVNGRRLTRIIYWSDRPMQIFPSSGLGPEPYDW